MSEQPPYQPPPPPPPPPPNQPPYGGYPPAQQTNGKAIAILVLGIISLPAVCGYGIGVVLAIVALALSPSAKREIAASEGRQTGESLVKAGVVCSWIAVGLTILGIIIVVAVIILAATLGDSTGPTTDTISLALTLIRP